MIIKAVRDLGKVSSTIITQRNKEIGSDIEDYLTVVSTAYKVFLVVLRRNIDGTFTYEGIRTEDFVQSKRARYLYARGTPSGTDIMPTSIINMKNPEKTVSKKFVKWFENINENALGKEARLSARDIDILSDMKEAIISIPLDDLVRDLKLAIKVVKNKTKQNAPDKKTKKNAPNLISLLIKEDDGKKERYLGDYEFFREILISHSLKRHWYKRQTNTRSLGEGTCFGCNKHEMVYGFTSIFPFYTMDKENFAPDLKIEDAWKVFPMCRQCILYLKHGKEFLDKYLKFSYYKHNYYLIPEFLLPPTEESISEIFKIFRMWKDPEKRTIILERKGLPHLTRLTDDEDEMFEMLAGEKNIMVFTFLFITEKQSQMVPEMVIPQVLPSRFRLLLDAKKQVEDLAVHDYLLQMPKGKNQEILDIEFNLGIVADIFRPKKKKPSKKKDVSKKPSKKKKVSKDFLQVTRHIFTGVKLSENVWYPHVMRYLRASLYDSEGSLNMFELSRAAIRSFQCMHYLSIIGVLELVETITQNESNISEWNGMSSEKNVKDEITNFFNNNSQFFNNDIKKGVFLLGVLTGRLLQYQYSDKKSRPFWNKLNNLQLDERRIKALLPKVINKFEEYDKRFPTVQDLETLTSQYLVSAGDGWKISADALSYYFTLGLSLHRMFSWYQSKDSAEINTEEDLE